MSGGVDSSVALAKVIEMGFEAIGITLDLFRPNDSDAMLEAKAAVEICKQFGVQHRTIDLRKEFNESIIDYFADAYFQGRTPNPCTKCNAEIKWGWLRRVADEMGVFYIATGHYVRLEKINDRRALLRANSNKDQSYMLWRLTDEDLRRSILPLGDMHKDDVREVARKQGMHNAEKADSQDVCFIPDGDYAAFLRKFFPEHVAEVPHGNIIENGEVVGQHPGFYNFTIGQRKGIGLSRPEPRFVQKIDAEKNSIRVVAKQEMYRDSCRIADMNFLLPREEIRPRLQVKIRYRSSLAWAKLSFDGKEGNIQFEEKQLAITPGQSAVFYHGNRLLGGGIIL